MNYYELYKINESPVIDKNVVSKKYIELQKQFHPDFFTNENETDKEDALTTSAAINKAYIIFSNKEKAIEYFLQQKGIIVADEKYNLPANFLMEMMELNEAIDENDATIQQKINAFKTELDAEIAAILSDEKINTLEGNALQQLKGYYYKKKYLKRILDRLDD